MAQWRVKDFYELLRNKDFVNTSLNQSWALVAGPLALVFIPLFLTRQLQGYYYAFISISALSVFADLGFSSIILQFAAHEFAFLVHKGKKFLFEAPEGEVHLRKLASLFIFSVKWTLGIIIVAYPLIFLIGFMLYKHNNDDVDWIVPWIIFSSGSAISFLNSSLLAFFEGCDMVARIQRLRFYNTLIFSVVVLTGLALHYNLYALAFASLLSSSFTFVILILSFKTVGLQLLRYSRQFIYKWRGEILTLFWKYCISYSSSYLIFQIYTPLAFRFQGAEEAGRVGFSIAVWTAVVSLANIWVVSVLPKINMLVATRKWDALDKLVSKRFLAGEITLIVTGLSFFLVYFIVARYFPIAGRFTSVTNLLILFVFWIIQFLVNTMTTYVRAHKEEPFYYIFLVSAVYIAVVTYLCTRLLPPGYVFAGLISSAFLFLPWYIYLFTRNRKLWH